MSNKALDGAMAFIVGFFAYGAAVGIFVLIYFVLSALFPGPPGHSPSLVAIVFYLAAAIIPAWFAIRVTRVAYRFFSDSESER